MPWHPVSSMRSLMPIAGRMPCQKGWDLIYLLAGVVFKSSVRFCMLQSILSSSATSCITSRREVFMQFVLMKLHLGTIRFACHCLSSEMSSKRNAVTEPWGLEEGRNHLF